MRLRRVTTSLVLSAAAVYAAAVPFPPSPIQPAPALLSASSGPAALRATDASELSPAASDSYLAWAVNSARRPNRFKVLMKPEGETAFRVNPRGTSGFPGDVDGDQFVYREIDENSNIRLYDLGTRETLGLPDQVNTGAREWQPSISGDWLLFGRVERNPGVAARVYKVFLFNLQTSERLELASTSERILVPGQVNGNWALWNNCGDRGCFIVRYNIAERTTERIQIAQPAYAGSIDADGTAYFASSEPACGAEVAFYKQPLGGPATLLFRVPEGRDVLTSHVYEDDGRTKVVFARVRCRDLSGDIYGFDTTEVDTPPDVGPDIATGISTTTYQINPAHSGHLADSTLRPPLRELWTTELGEGISYPLVAEGKIFVTVRGGDAYGTRIYALDASTGTIAWFQDLEHTYNWSNAAYGEGKVFVVTFDGVMYAFDADDGTNVWTTDLGSQYAFSSEPNYDAGLVYTGGAGSGGTLYAVRASDGTVAWTKSVANGDHSSPTLSADKVFVGYAGPQVYAFDRTTGAERWHYAGCCSGGGGRTTVFHQGYLYNRIDESIVLDAADGQKVATFDSIFTPAFAGSRGLFFNANKLSAREVPFGSVEWSFQGDGFLNVAPVIANGYAYIGSSIGNLYAVDLQNGTSAWKTKLPWGIYAPDEHNVATPVTGLGLGRGLLVVPNGPRLTAFVNG